MSSRLRSLGYRALAAAGTVATFATLGRSRLRILGYHDVPDVDLFARQVEWLTRRLTPVSPSRAIEIIAGDRAVEHPVLITFDDGDPSVVEMGQPVLDRFGIKAALFVCPAVVDSTTPFWWEIVDLGVGSGIEVDGTMLGPESVRVMKSLPDHERRQRVARISEALAEAGIDASRPQLTTAQLQSWVASGHGLGNHSWDHPILDTCAESEQSRQIELAHEWLSERGLLAHPMFAYPNGNRTGHARSVLEARGYSMALLFDHRLVEIPAGFELSRLRVNADDPLHEFIARVSGIHPMAHALRGGR